MDLSSDRSALSVLFVAPECAPLTKTGGLGDVCGALPGALRALGVDVRVLMPGYPEVLAQASGKPLARIGALGREARVLRAQLPGKRVPILVLDCPELYARRGGPYQADGGADWPDNALRFGFLSHAAALLASARSPLRWRPDVLHANDWPSALAPVFLSFEEQSKAKSVMTIHNLAFQGNFDPALLSELGLPPGSYSIDGLEFYGRLSFLKGGIVHADAVTTVSPTYAAEIQTAQFGCGLDGLLRQRGHALTGILNGIDTSAWNPEKDSSIPASYGPGSLGGKAASKKALQETFGLAVDRGLPLFGSVGRMTSQKGTDLLLEAGAELAAAGQLVIVGSGDRALEQAARELERAHPGRVGVRVGFSEGLAHLVEAGADIFLMPSRYEPCGLNQMYSQRYGTPPVVRATGGLVDSVEDGVTGFLFDLPEEEDFLKAIKRAVAHYHDRSAWTAMQRAAMARDFSWDAAARRYADLYLSLATRQTA